VKCAAPSAVAKAILTSQMTDLKILPKLLIPTIGGIKVLSHPRSFKCS